jgi:hypothetical protein
LHSIGAQGFSRNTNGLVPDDSLNHYRMTAVRVHTRARWSLPDWHGNAGPAYFLV